ncbi:MAG TPA: hypothetical protein DIC57_06850 [Sphaerochaeta sp.]|nr:hypothetical protein [Sphaerochaeta sp.]
MQALCPSPLLLGRQSCLLQCNSVSPNDDDHHLCTTPVQRLCCPIAEELFFSGYLTSHVRRFGKAAPLVITILFSLYHLWAPFANIFSVIIFIVGVAA